MALSGPGGYMGKILRVDLTNQTITEESVRETIQKEYLGGTGVGSKYLYEEVPPGVEWSDPENRLMWFTGPVNGTQVSGSGMISVVSKGPMTNMAGASQANGFFGAFIKFCGFDGVIIQGAAEKWVYLCIDDDRIELRDASSFVGKDTRKTEDAIRQELGGKRSVYGIGPAGENRVRFACIVGDHGHVIAHNGLGAVMGSKRLKAITVVRGKQSVPVKDPVELKHLAQKLFVDARDNAGGIIINKWGTAGTYPVWAKSGGLPVKNYTTNIFPDYERFSGEYLRTHFKVKPSPCFACRMGHCHEIEVTEGPYKGFAGEEPEYEGLAATSSLIGQLDPGASVMLANLTDWLGMDVNESGWVIAWVMECYEKGLLTKSNLDGLEMNWGNAEATAELLQKIANRQGCGDLLAEGVKRAAERIGGDALSCAIYTLKGASPRTHDHRAVWKELFDTCLSNTGTIETSGGNFPLQQIGLPPAKNPFDPEEVSSMNAKINGRRQFEDSLCICRFCVYDFQQTVGALNAVTGWDFSIHEAMDLGQRIVNQLRLFNFRHGLTKDMEAPSQRYGSMPVDGPAQGISILPHWDFMRRNYYKHMGWDPETGKPLPETLQRLGLEHLIPDLRQLK